MVKCTIDGCEKPQLSRGWCTKHYTMWSRKGDPLARTNAEKGNRGFCSLPNCCLPVHALGLCDPHYRANHRYGRTYFERAPKGSGYINKDGYRAIKSEGKSKFEHVVIAEKALGKTLPLKAEVHHVNGNRADNRNTNLVVCPSLQYHRLLHKRQRDLGITF